jgi:short-subunit dehydrogenase
MVHSWKDRVVLLTGASSGIGRGLAVALGKQGAAVGLLARRPTELAEVATEVEAAGGRPLSLPADVTDAAAVRAAAETLRRDFGPIDLMIANAGVGGTTDGRVLDAVEVGRILQINLQGAVNSAAAVIPEMVARGSGQLVVISSLASYRGLPKSGAYSASKAGVSAFYESLRIDLAGTGVDVTIIHPGFIKTPLTAGREAKMPFLMELDDAIRVMMRGIEQRKKSFAFPWQLATIVRAGMLMPIALYDFISARNSFRE